jgi:DNA topoisomerase-1
MDAAKAAGLRYVSDAKPGVRRLRAGTGFKYVDAEGRAVRDKETLARIKSLVIPPAWTDVWICPSPNGHLQATGRDARGRKQGRYHPQWRAHRDASKYERMAAFAAALPKIRKRVRSDLKKRGLPREKVLATIVSLMEETLIRVGNEEYARTNHSYGLTTLRNKHVDVHGAKITFDFAGKSGVHHTVDLRDARLARIVRQCEELPGQELFQYVDDDGNRHSVDSSDVNEYLREATGEHFTAKDFRTWAGSVLACVTLGEIGPFETKTEAKKNVVAAIKRVAEKLGNTPSVCRKCYVHPAVLESYLEGRSKREAKLVLDRAIAKKAKELREDERQFLALLEARMEL